MFGCNCAKAIFIGGNAAIAVITTSPTNYICDYQECGDYVNSRNQFQVRGWLLLSSHPHT